jgi:hypothetical protein
MYRYPSGAISMNTSLAGANGTLGSFTGSLNIPAAAGWDWNAIRLLSGDVNGDGRTDAIMPYRRSDNSIGLFTSLATASGGFGPFVIGYLLPANAWDWNSFRTISGDFNGDGRADIAAMYRYPSGAISMNTSLAGANGTLGSFTGSLNIPAAAGWDWNAIRLLSGDVNGDGRTDAMMLYHHLDNSIQAFSSQANTGGGFGPFVGSYKVPANDWDWNAFASFAGDFNGDGRADLAVAYHHPSGSISLNSSPADVNGIFGPFTGSLAMTVANGWNWKAS